MDRRMPPAFGDLLRQYRELSMGADDGENTAPVETESTAT